MENAQSIKKSKKKKKGLDEELKLRNTVICDKRFMLLQFVRSLEIG